MYGHGYSMAKVLDHRSTATSLTGNIFFSSLKLKITSDMNSVVSEVISEVPLPSFHRRWCTLVKKKTLLAWSFANFEITRWSTGKGLCLIFIQTEFFNLFPNEKTNGPCGYGSWIISIENEKNIM